MGCTPSAVKPSDVICPDKNHNEVKENQLRGDRVSMVEARHKREEDSRNRLRKLSAQVPGLVDKAVLTKTISRGSSSTPNERSAQEIPSIESNQTELENQANAIVQQIISGAKLKYNQQQSNTPIILVSPIQPPSDTELNNAKALVDSVITKALSQVNLAQ